MAERDDKPHAPGAPGAPPVLEQVVEPFAADVEQWETDLDAWDRALPIAPPVGTTGLLDEENPFLDSPITEVEGAAIADPGLEGPPSGVVSGPFDADLSASSGSYAALITDVNVNAQLAIPTGTFDDGTASASGSYAALVTDVPVSRVTTIFDLPPPDEPPVSFPSETLPEMGSGPWEGEASATLTIGPAPGTSAPGVETWRELGQALEDELGKAETTERRAELALAAARVAELLGDVSGARGYVERALANDRLMGPTPEGWTAAHRARLCLAERSGTMPDDAAALESLARLAVLPHPDQGAYRALQTEGTLLRVARGMADGSAVGQVAGLARGLPRALAEAELAWRDPAAAAAILAQAGQSRADALGAALLVIAAARNEVGRDLTTAAEQRAAAAALDPGRLFMRAGLLRDIARQSPEEGLVALRALLPVFAPSPLKVTLALWGAKLAARAGQTDDAWALIADPGALGPVTPALARERLSLRLATGAPLAREEARELLGALLETFDGVPANIVVTGFACAWAGDDEARAEALERIEALRRDGVDVTALAPAIEGVAAGAAAPELHHRALRLWRETDAARWLTASHALMDGEGDAVADEIADRDPRGPLFLARAARAAGEGRFADAAGLLESGAAAWGHTRLAVPLRELAAERLARVDLAAACDRLTALAAGDVEPAVRLTLGRALRARRDGGRWLAYVRGLSAEGDSADRRATLLLEGQFWNEGPGRDAGDDERTAAGSGDTDLALAGAFDLVPLHPVATGLMLARGTTVAALAAQWMAAAQTSPSPRIVLEAALLLAASGEPRQALALLLSRVPEHSRGASDDAVDDATRAAIRRLAWAEAAALARAALLQKIGRPDEPVPSWARAEGARDGVAVPIEVGQQEETVAVAPGSDRTGDRLAALEQAARTGRWSAVVDRLIDASPIAAGFDPETSSLALDLEAAQPGPARRAPELLAALRAPGATSDAAPSVGLAYHAFVGALRGEPGAAPALEAAAALATRLSDGRSAALFLLEAAQVDPHETERLLRAAVARDPASAPAASAWRRFLIREGRVAEAAEASGAEAEALVEVSLRVTALVRAAALAQVEPPGQDGPPRAARLSSSAAFLRRALVLQPENNEVFGRLRELYDEAGEHAALADLLAARLTVTTNPFETTALHLARAELFAGPLDEPARARAELAGILAKEPNHARALGRLADLEESQGNYAATAELLVQRSAAERSPEKVRELFLRLGRIHVQRLPDAKRAIAAYARVLQLDAKNREALDALSQLYVEQGDAKNANVMTERLLGVEDSAARRVVYHLRLGHIAERGGDQLAALAHFRRAVDESPRDVRGITELARYLEKLHDLTSRRQMLDTAAGQLRAAVLARPGFAADRDALASVQRLRGRPAAAAAASELGAFLSGEAAPAEGRPRRLSAVVGPALEDRLFPDSVPPSVRHLFRMLAPIERSSYRPEPGRWGAERGHRVGDGRSPRDIFDRVAGELGVGPYELYVVPSRVPPPLVALPGKPPAIVVGAALLRGGPAAVRFVAGWTLRLTSSSLDVALAGGEGELAVWLTGVIRQFVPTYQRADVTPDQAAAAAARMARLLPKRARPELLPFALESSGELDVTALAAGIRQGADRVGLLASGSLAASLGVIFAAAGEGVSADAIRELPQARALVEFALSDEHDDLVQSLGDAR